MLSTRPFSLSRVATTAAALTLALGLLAPAASAQTLPGVLKYLGDYKAQKDGPDEIQHMVPLGSKYLVAASVTGLALVDRVAAESGPVEFPISKHVISRDLISNLDGIDTASLMWAPKFYEVAVSAPYVYTTARYDGLWVFRIDKVDGVRTPVEVNRLMRPREFSEGLEIADGLLFVTHHADGLEVLDITADPIAPPTVASVTAPLIDAWRVEVLSDGSVWVADGAGGLKRFQWNGSSLDFVGGDDLSTSPGTVLDVAVVNSQVVAALGGQGVAIYDKTTLARLSTVSVPGACLSVEAMSSGRVALSCREWLHVAKIRSDGALRILASTRMHNRTGDVASQLETHFGYGVAVDGEKLYVGAWHWGDVYQYMLDDPDDTPELWVSSQRAHFSAAGDVEIELTSAGEGTVVIDSVNCPKAVTVSLPATELAPGESMTLTLSWDGTEAIGADRLHILSNDPNDPSIPIFLIGASEEQVDEGDVAYDAVGPTILRDYETGTFDETTMALGDVMSAGDVLYMPFAAIFCPPFGPNIAAMVNDVAAKLPDGVGLLVFSAQAGEETVRHVLEKFYMPVRIFIGDEDAALLYEQPDNDPSLGLPFVREYVVRPDWIVTHVGSNGYNPAGTLAAIDEALAGDP